MARLNRRRLPSFVLQCYPSIAGKSELMQVSRFVVVSYSLSNPWRHRVLLLARTRNLVPRPSSHSMSIGWHVRRLRRWTTVTHPFALPRKYRDSDTPL